MTLEKYASVILDLSIDKMLDYEIPAAYLGKVKRGMKVKIPLRNQWATGYVFALKESTPMAAVKPIEALLSEEELISEELFALALWMAKYYCAPLRAVLKTILPAVIRKEKKHKQQLYVVRGKTKEELAAFCEKIRNKSSAQADVLDVMLKVKKGILLSELLEATQGSRSPVDTLAKKGYLRIDIVRVDRSPLLDEEYFRTKPKSLTDEQTAALQRIRESLQHNRFETHLIYGVTGSGKTEIYLQAAEKTLSLGKGVIILVPEISLTAQTIERFRSRFDTHLAVLHHRLSQGERFDEWHRLRRGDAKIAIGARSAIFSPVRDLGLIIVDEEHEASYKQAEHSPVYHARDVAVMRGKLSGSTIVLGSATPSLESYYNAKKGKYTLSCLTKRAAVASIPKMTLVDMKREFEKAKGYCTFSDPLLTAIKKRCEVGEQTILFLNRRGYHTMLLCQVCGKVVKCNHCDVSLTFHLTSNSLACHLCSASFSPPPACCPSCSSAETLKYRGIGTEQVERALHAIFPTVRTLRIDADTTRHKGSHQRLLKDFASGKADVLIGTQMVAKGLHFPQVTLVGVLHGDASLSIPDFRASETTFQLITQVAGRAGRGELPGEVIVQTNLPDNKIMQLAAAQDYSSFYEEEIAIRQLFNYPPFIQMAKIAFSGKGEEQTRAVAEQIRALLLQNLPATFELNPVVAAGHAKVKDLYRFQFLIKGNNIYLLAREIEQLAQKKKVPSSISLFVDVNPTTTFF